MAEWKQKLLKPSTLLCFIIALIFILMVLFPNANPTFFDSAKDVIKILCGAVGGAVAGEKYSEKGEPE